MPLFFSLLEDRFRHGNRDGQADALLSVVISCSYVLRTIMGSRRDRVDERDSLNF